MKDIIQLFKSMKNDNLTTTQKVNTLLNLKKIYPLNKKELANRLDISRVTLDSRLNNKTKWKFLEEKYINELYNTTIKNA